MAIALASLAGELILASGVMMMLGLMVLIAHPLAPADGLGHNAESVAALGDLVGMEGVSHLIGLEER